MYTHTHTRKHTRTYTYTSLQPHMYSVHTNNPCSHTCTHTHTHTHTHNVHLWSQESSVACFITNRYNVNAHTCTQTLCTKWHNFSSLQKKTKNSGVCILFCILFNPYHTTSQRNLQPHCGGCRIQNSGSQGLTCTVTSGPTPEKCLHGGLVREGRRVK